MDVPRFSWPPLPQPFSTTSSSSSSSMFQGISSSNSEEADPNLAGPAEISIGGSETGAGCLWGEWRGLGGGAVGSKGGPILCLALGLRAIGLLKRETLLWTGALLHLIMDWGAYLDDCFGLWRVLPPLLYDITHQLFILGDTTITNGNGLWRAGAAVKAIISLPRWYAMPNIYGESCWAQFHLSYLMGRE